MHGYICDVAHFTAGHRVPVHERKHKYSKYQSALPYDDHRKNRVA